MIQLRHFSIEAIQCNAERLKCLETAFDVYTVQIWIESKSSDKSYISSLWNGFSTLKGKSHFFHSMCSITSMDVIQMTSSRKCITIKPLHLLSFELDSSQFNLIIIKTTWRQICWQKLYEPIELQFPMPDFRFIPLMSHSN